VGGITEAFQKRKGATERHSSKGGKRLAIGVCKSRGEEVRGFEEKRGGGDKQKGAEGKNREGGGGKGGLEGLLEEGRILSHSEKN